MYIVGRQIMEEDRTVILTFANVGIFSKQLAPDMQCNYKAT